MPGVRLANLTCCNIAAGVDAYDPPVVAKTCSLVLSLVVLASQVRLAECARLYKHTTT